LNPITEQVLLTKQIQNYKSDDDSRHRGDEECVHEEEGKEENSDGWHGKDGHEGTLTGGDNVQNFNGDCRENRINRMMARRIMKL
jgi:hypothetical protein